jgi:DNA invertase Pin-like site-specific DNA recombinase
MTTSKPIRAAIYARVSTTNHNQDVGLQLDELRAVAIQRGWQVVDEYVDEGISGTATERPALDRMLDDARRGKLGIVVVWRLDRLGRSLKHLLKILAELQHLGVGFVSLRDSGIDTTSATGRLMLHLLAAFAEYERALIRERVLAGVARAQAKGTHCGRPKVVMDVRPALALAREGHSQRTIAAMLGVSRGTLRRRLREAGQKPLLKPG